MSGENASGLTLALAERSATVTFEQLPEDVVELARHTLLDWFGVTLGGCRLDGPEMLLAVLAGELADGGAASAGGGAVSVVGHRQRLPVLDAALVNGTASHRLDFDDVNMAFVGHASVAVLAAALALAEQRDATAGELIAGFLAGYETACRIARAIGPEPYLRGFHYTGTVGTFGAAAACARLLELEPGATARAFGIAASEAAGLKCNLGTMTKSLHAGRACQNGLLAAMLAARGFTAEEGAIEAEQGFAALAGGRCDAAAALAEPPSGWHLRENLFKYHAACFFTHSTLEGIRELRRDGGLDAGELEGLTLHVGALELGACAIPEPATALEVKFSLAHLAAMALLDRDTSTISDEDAGDPELVALRAKVTLCEDGAPGEPTRVEAALRDGTILRAAHDISLPERELDLQRERLAQKFLGLAEPVLRAPGAGALLQRLATLEPDFPVQGLMALARP